MKPQPITAKPITPKPFFFRTVLTKVGEDLGNSLTVASLRVFEENSTATTYPPKLPVITSAFVDFAITAPLSFIKHSAEFIKGIGRNQ